MKRPYLIIGVCQRPHGTGGEILVKSLTDDDTRFFEGLTCYLLEDAEGKPLERLSLSGARPTDKGLLLSFSGIESRDRVRALSGRYLAVKRENALALESDDEFYYGDLIGLAVTDRKAGPLGRIFDILDAGSGEILIVRQEGDKDVLIPFLRSIILKTDADAGQMEVLLPDGLLELYRTNREA
ncbi:MAG TPA: 16S rRNA processing protein RimM [Clostridiaceae bacterium]|nr:16S rRNA processing protein RimM [Clostridiaceae bacterium]